MAKLLLSCDEYIIVYKGNYYFRNKVDKMFFYRYLRVFEQLRIACRCEEINSPTAQMIPIEDKRIEVHFLSVFHGPKQYVMVWPKLRKETKGVADGCDAAILRLPSTIAQRIYVDVRKKKIPYCTEIVYDAFDGSRAETNFIKKLLWKNIDRQMRRICGAADGVSCVTEKYLQKRYCSFKEDAFTSFYSSLALEDEYLRGFRCYPQKERFLIGHVSDGIKFNGRKGIKELLKAVSILKNKGILVDVSFAGGEKDWDSCKQLMEYARQLNIENNVEIAGYLSRKDLGKFLEKADVFVFPTKAEGLPRVLIEAMAKGLPCITTPVSGNPELIQPEFLVEYYDVALLATKIKELITTKDVYEKASKDNYNKSLQYRSEILEKRRDMFYSKLKNKI